MLRIKDLTALPIDAVLGDIVAALANKTRLVLVAPPGAGKTTRVPLALLGAEFTNSGKILLLEPRRLAARAAAQRMARTLDERVGETIGLSVRLESRIGPRTRVEVVTEGVFTRMILDDPELTGVAAVIFDEFHERSLDADLGLALALDAQSGLREDLRILVMSATLDGARVGALMSDAALIESEGRAFPVETRYIGRDPTLRIEENVVKTVLGALIDEPGSLLVFLPGQTEILRTAQELSRRLRRDDVEIAPLYGAMDMRAQDIAVAPAPFGRRKIVLATSIAETSLTIEGVRVVIDSGLSRVPVYEPDIGLTRLETHRVSRASADQRRGRAGRTEPGTCYRLWEEAATGGLALFSTPEILSADLTGFALDLAVWGVRDAAALKFLDAPPAPALKEARATLTALGALDADGALTDEGRAVARLALPPRLARMLVDAARDRDEDLAARIVVAITERGLGGESVDLARRLDEFARDRTPRADDARALARRFATKARASVAAGAERREGVGFRLAEAFPERIAMARGRPGEFLMANGRAASLEPQDALARQSYLAVGEISGRAAATRIRLAAALTLAEIERVAGHQINVADEIAFDRQAAALRGRRRRRLGALTLAESPLPPPRDAATAEKLALGVLALGADRLPWSSDLSQLRDRVMFLRSAEGNAWPDVSNEALAASSDWLSPFLLGKIALSEITPDDLRSALDALLPYDLKRRLDSEAPTHFRAPTGTSAAVDYGADGGPSISLRVQELFGLKEHPALAGGRVPLTLHLLSPAHRPVQITRDLPGFWRGSWAAVRADLRGRYPRHSWPEDPAAAAPTTRAKPRGT